MSSVERSIWVNPYSLDLIFTTMRCSFFWKKLKSTKWHFENNWPLVEVNKARTQDFSLTSHLLCLHIKKCWVGNDVKCMKKNIFTSSRFGFANENTATYFAHLHILPLVSRKNGWKLSTSSSKYNLHTYISSTICTQMPKAWDYVVHIHRIGIVL